MRNAGDAAAETFFDLSPQTADKGLDRPPIAVDQEGRNRDAGDGQPDWVHQQRPADPQHCLPDKA
ncbi:hypothetical protein D3C76_1849270 [compost metagenome]